MFCYRTLEPVTSRGHPCIGSFAGFPICSCYSVVEQMMLWEPMVRGVCYRYAMLEEDRNRSVELQPSRFGGNWAACPPGVSTAFQSLNLAPELIFWLGAQD
ncbi:uncharacterized protein M421DRAFT_223039 [Didymella exigua CBS 183.55]|uniref:Uncharacterized protein n=1 Tax=Didymella exigua CBS 183.55 TaxID=1150837 RepID=A0A6A5RFF4_9PLEO|nr:uncharacterized protein M421DRAFT_223039 [Didymella exigua CBS 183.55]KAF1926020.1 hypothetical protein M421DRAFT_223039 [Didymella exigua CBS 183.55]